MRYGHFDDAAREYVIDRPDTPRSWSNYLGNTRYGAIITNNAGGYSFYRSAAQGRFTRLHFNTVPLDQPGRYVYLRDADSGDYWSASWQPVGKPLEQYESECRHGTGYSVIGSTYSGIRASVSYFVPQDADFEVWLVELENRSDRPRRLSAFSFVELASEWHFFHDNHNLQYSQYIVDVDHLDHGAAGATLVQHMCRNLPLSDRFEDRDQTRRTFVSLVGTAAAGFDADRDVFLGSPYRTYREPLVVERGACTGSRAHGDNGCGTFQVDVTLAPGEKRQFLVLLGVGGADAAEAARSRVPDAAAAERELVAVKAYWHARLGALQVQTPDSELDSMVNVWNAYNCLVTYAWSRAASLVYSGERDGLGFRDTVQDILGVLPAIAEEAGERLRLMLTGQLNNGGAMPIVKPFSHTPGSESPPPLHEYRADDALWLFNTVPAYVKETGNLSFFDEVLPYADSGSATVLGHLRRALEFNLERTGVHGLPVGLSADWNDALRFGERGESVFVALQLRFGLATYIEICERLARHAEVEWARGVLVGLDAALNQHAWDGAWYARGFRDDGTPVGSAQNAEGSFYLNPQSWAVLSGAASGDRARAVMDAVNTKLATEYGIALCTPPYLTENVSVIRSVLFNPGMKENGGIFCHPQGWAVMAECALGRGERAYAFYRAYMPAAYNDRAELRQIEPYVHCQSTHGPGSRRLGASRLPWLSGTASWSYVAGTQHLLGLRPDWDGLRVDPVIPKAWSGFTARRRFRGAEYVITVENPNHVEAGIAELIVDGEMVAVGSPIPLAKPGTRCEVRVVMGA